METRMCFEFKHGLADISKCYPEPEDTMAAWRSSCINARIIHKRPYRVKIFLPMDANDFQR
jgi:hypothetical protein